MNNSLEKQMEGQKTEIEQLIDQVKQNLEGAATFENLQKNKELLTKIRELNAVDTQKMQNEIQKTIEVTQNPNDKAEYERLLLAMQTERSVLDAHHQEATGNIASGGRTALDRISVELQDHAMEYEYDENGQLSPKSIKLMMANLDGSELFWWVEVNNKILWSWTQKFAIGESQIYELIKDFDMKQINELYSRVTGDSSAEGLSYIKVDQGNDNRPDQQYKQRIKNFQDMLVQRADTIADISALMFPDAPGDVRMGLASIVNGREQNLLQNLTNPEMAQQFAERLANSDVYKENPNILGQILWMLTQAGLSVAVGVLSGGVVSAKYQTRENTVENIAWEIQKDAQWNVVTWPDGKPVIQKSVFDLQNLSVTKEFWDSQSVVVDVNISPSTLPVSLDVAYNWNDPQTIMKNGLTEFIRAGDKMMASQMIIEHARQKAGIPEDKKEQFETMSKQFKEAQNMIMAAFNNMPAETRSEEQLGKKLSENALIYMSNVLNLRGITSKGIYATAWLTGFAVGLSASEVRVGGTYNNVNKESGFIEAQATAREARREETEKVLAQFGIIKNPNWDYVRDGKVVIPHKEWHEIAFQMSQVVDFTHSHLDISYQYFDTKTQTYSQSIHLTLENIDSGVNNETANVELIAGSLLQWRKSPQLQGLVVTLQQQIDKNDYNSAKQTMDQLISKVNNPAMKEQWEKLQKLPNQDGMYRRILELTSGWTRSRELADNIREGKLTPDQIRAEIRKYYNEKWNNGQSVAQAFENMFQLQKAGINIDNLLNSMLSTDLTAKTLGVQTERGFRAMVAYSQLNAGRRGFKGIEDVKHSDAQIFGTPTKLEWASADAMRQQIAAQLSPDDIKVYADRLKTAYGNVPGERANWTDQKWQEEAKRLMVGGNVYSYLSFAEHAECFNLGFYAEPLMEDVKYENGKIIPPDYISVGSIVGSPTSNTREFGLAIGIKPGENKNPENKEEPSSTTTQTGERPPVASSVAPEVPNIETQVVNIKVDWSTLNSVVEPVSIAQGMGENIANTVTRVRVPPVS